MTIVAHVISLPLSDETKFAGRLTAIFQQHAPNEQRDSIIINFQHLSAPHVFRGGVSLAQERLPESRAHFEVRVGSESLDHWTKHALQSEIKKLVSSETRTPRENVSVHFETWHCIGNSWPATFNPNWP